MSKVCIVMGSKSDLSVARVTMDALTSLGVGYLVHIVSAHRTPCKIDEVVSEVESEGCKAIIAIAGMAAHLPGVIASKTLIPVIGVPVPNHFGGGSDALFSIVQMPPGVPVACMAINGAKNAALYAIQILAQSDPKLLEKLTLYRARMAQEVEEADSELNECFEYFMDEN